MVDITRIHVHFVQVKDNEKTDSKIVKKRPSDPENVLRLKEDIAEIVAKQAKRNHWTYYYVVIEVEKKNGGSGYRTVVPKTML